MTSDLEIIRVAASLIREQGDQARLEANVNDRLGSIPALEWTKFRRRRMSPCGYKRTLCGRVWYVCFTPDSRHSSAEVRYRADFVRLPLRSRRSWQGLGMSQFDPKPT